MTPQKPLSPKKSAKLPPRNARISDDKIETVRQLITDNILTEKQISEQLAISTKSVQRIVYNRLRPTYELFDRTQDGQIRFRKVPVHICPKCGHRITIRPCPACISNFKQKPLCDNEVVDS